MGKIVSLRPESFANHPYREASAKLTEPVSVRITQEQGRMIDEALAVLRKEGAPIKTRSDFFRWAGESALEWLSGQLHNIEDMDANWLRDQLILGRLDQELNDQLAAEERAHGEIDRLKQFLRANITISNYAAAAVAFNKFSKAMSMVSDPIWRLVMRKVIASDAELKQIQNMLIDHGYSVGLVEADFVEEEVAS